MECVVAQVAGDSESVSTQPDVHVEEDNVASDGGEPVDVVGQSSKPGVLVSLLSCLSVSIL